MKATSRILQFFCYDYFEDLLAPTAFANRFCFPAGFATFAKKICKNPTAFAKKFCFPAGVDFKIFAIKNALQSKNRFLRNACGKIE